jgi:hypothetical protein
MTIVLHAPVSIYTRRQKILYKKYIFNRLSLAWIWLTLCDRGDLPGHSKVPSVVTVMIYN